MYYLKVEEASKMATLMTKEMLDRRWNFNNQANPAMLDCHLIWKKSCITLNNWNNKIKHLPSMHTVSFDWFLSGLEWILNLVFSSRKLLIFYQKLFWNIRSRLNSSTFWLFRPVFRYVWSKLKLCAQKLKILIKHI